MEGVVCTEMQNVQPHTEVDMAEEEVRQLLLEAENRLRAPRTRGDSNPQPANENESLDASLM